ncbi:aminotransferase class I/II-fold pyridoxal phosphate-dependent enzyme [Nocardia spumae]|uniref:aminotransferase class I/II-fold pyridoxal phosphate-dependent enzyme n=1 Tax=Nocardia spumae TaxID=2887190 RepID=UPI001D135354|nr:aminotransferase class I/II-fold pyridoxal phosphate-dependent enzyme [Nocardia spumae]
MSESARDLARKLLSSTESPAGEGNGARGRGAVGTGAAPTAARAATAPRPDRAVRGPGKQFADHPGVVAAAAQRATIAALTEQSGLPSPYFLPRSSPNDHVIRSAAGELINFSAYNYLGLASHPRVVAAATAALDEYGASASASRIVGGEIPLYQEIEQRLAGIYDVGDAMVTTSGYLTNAGVIGYLLGAGDVAFCDTLIHGSVVSGTQWAGCRRINFRHNDPESLRAVLRTSRSGFDRALVVLEGHYSMDGTVGRVAELAAVAREYDCAVMVDEAHSFGVFGAGGHGIREHYAMAGADVDIWMGTLSKALGSCGGFLAGDADLIGAMKSSAPGIAMLTGAPAPSAIAAALAGLDVLADEPDRLTRLWDNTRRFHGALRERGMDLGDSQRTPICPVIIPGETHAGFVSATLLREGIYAGAIVAPTVPVGKERLRFFLTSEHTERQLDSTVELIAETAATLDRLSAAG